MNYRNDNPPIICDMTGAADTISERMAEYRRLFTQSLLGRDRTGTGIRFRFRADKGLEDWVRDLADREQACCAFFSFTVTASDDEVWWDASVIDDDMARQILDEFYRLPGCSLYTGWTSEYAAAVPAWKAIEQAEPEFAGRVRRLFDAGRHKTIATLRADGSPRVSGIECEFTDGDLRFGSMTGARKGADLQRDPRFALHGPAFHPEEGKERDWPGEAKIAGRAILAGPVATDEAGGQPDGQMLVADITEVVITGLNAEATKLVVESWTPERGLRRVERD